MFIFIIKNKETVSIIKLNKNYFIGVLYTCK